MRLLLTSLYCACTQDAMNRNFIKKNTETTGGLLTVNQSKTPYIYIPGDPAVTAVYNYQNQPMICHKFFICVHIKKWCKQTEIWNEPKCPNCEYRRLITILYLLRIDFGFQTEFIAFHVILILFLQKNVVTVFFDNLILSVTKL